VRGQDEDYRLPDTAHRGAYIFLVFSSMVLSLKSGGLVQSQKANSYIFQLLVAHVPHPPWKLKEKVIFNEGMS
jgi:hypothetical protein